MSNILIKNPSYLAQQSSLTLYPESLCIYKYNDSEAIIMFSRDYKQ